MKHNTIGGLKRQDILAKQSGVERAACRPWGALPFD